MTKKILLIAAIIITSNAVYADILHGNNYISPERYAVNEADMQIDYSKIPPAPKLDLDKLDDMRFQAPNLVEKDFSISTDDVKEEVSKVEEKISKKSKNQRNDKEVIDENEAYKKKLSYKFAKWWVDKRYEREEEHHGSMHEIKVQKRLDYEKAQEEKVQEQQK